MTQKKSIFLATVATLLLASSLLIGCGGAATPAPTSAPAPAAKPAATSAPAAAPAPTKAAAAAPAPTKAAAAAPARAEGFFKDKTISILLPNSAGQGNDTSLRYVVPFIKEAAGAKDINVENMPGAGGMLGFNKNWNAKTDGLNWGSGSAASMMLQQLTGQEGVQWDVSKINFLGRIYNDTRVLITPAKGGVKTVDDAIKLGRPLNLPIQGLDEDNLSQFLVVNLLGLKAKLITGYQGESDVFLACLRGEGDWAISARNSALPMVKNGDMVPVLILGPQRLKEFPDTPTVMEILDKQGKGQSAKDSMQAVINIQQLLLSLTLPPGVDPKVVAEARYVVDKALSDPKVAAGMPAKTGGRELTYMPGVDEQAAVNQIMSQSSTLVPILKEAEQSVK